MAKGKSGFWEEISPQDKKKLSKDGLKKALSLFKYTLPYKNVFIIGMAFLVLSTLTTMAFPLLIGEMTKVMEGKSAYTINQVAIFFGIILICQGIFSFFRVYFFSIVSEKTAADLRTILYDKFITTPITFFENNRVGDLMSRITSDISAIQNVLSTTLAEFFRQIATMVIGISILIYISWKLTIFMLATFPIIVIAALLFGRYIRVISKKVQDKLAESNVIVEETLQSISIVKAFTNENLESKKFRKTISETVTLALKAATLRGGFITFFIIGLFGGIVLVIWFGGKLVISHEILIAELITFLTLTIFVGGSLSGLGDLYAQLQRTVGASERILEILNEKTEVILNQEIVEGNIIGSVEFENVNFSYPSRKDVEVLKNLNFSIKAGEQIAIVGPSGAGKSTVVQLLMKFYQLENGVIKIDNKDIKNQDVTDLRQHIAIVPQEVILFGGTILENIAYGKPSATFSEIEKAAQRANAMEFIEKFPERFDTIVGERGVKLSGGQRQRIAIARAILKNPAILLLDEATSALDSESEKLVQDALNELMKNRTSIVIAHRLATIRNVDKIYVLKNGEIAESGNHDELILKTDGIYANLVKMQFENSSKKLSEWEMSH
jgi:ATP-binding cassette subfamily B protein